MILTSPRDQEGKEQRHGVINARETACWKRGCSSVPPCPEEGERDHAAGVLCHHRVQSSVCSLLTAYLCKARDPGNSDLGAHQTLSLAQRTQACVWSCRSGRAHLAVSPERRPLWEATQGSHAGTPPCPGGNRRRAPRTKPGSLLRLIPIVSSRELSAAAPGQVEVDLVSHDGGKAAGDHCYTLTVTDRCSGWTAIAPVPSRAQVCFTPEP